MWSDYAALSKTSSANDMQLYLLTACGGNGEGDVDGDGGGFEGESLMRQWLERLYLLI